MKKIMSTVLVAAMIMSAGATTAFTEANVAVATSTTTKGTYESLSYTKYDDHVEITDFDGSVTDLEIPAEIEGLPVTIIGESAFESASALETVIVPEGVTTIGISAFYRCTSLKSISLPSTLKAIKFNAFASCISLEKIEIPEGTTTIADQAFMKCANLRTVIINNGATSLKKWTFRECNITTLYLPKSVVGMYSAPFDGGSVKEIYYAGSPEQWDVVEGSKEVIFKNTIIHYGAENFEGPLTPDVNRDGAVDASDASCILAYYAYTMTGGTGTIEEFLAQ